MKAFQDLDAGELLSRVAERVPTELRNNVVVVGSIASAWAYRDILGHAGVATKDIDVLLQPAIDAVATAENLAQQLLDLGWRPIYPNGRAPGTSTTPENELPALRLSPHDEQEGWFVELLGSPEPDQNERRVWRRFETPIGVFALPCFRCMPVATHAAEQTEFGIRAARPARMALAHLLEHADPDTTPISNLPGNPPRFTKDVGRAVSLWWLAQEQSSAADEEWLDEWRETLAALYPNQQALKKQDAARGLASVRNYLLETHAIAARSVLAPHGTTIEAWGRAHADLEDLIQQI